MGVDIIRGWISKVLPGYHEQREMNYDFSQEIETTGIYFPQGKGFDSIRTFK